MEEKHWHVHTISNENINPEKEGEILTDYNVENDPLNLDSRENQPWLENPCVNHPYNHMEFIC